MRRAGGGIRLVAVAREVERQAVRAPREVALARLAFGHAAGRSLVVGRAYEEVAVGDERHRLPIGRERHLAHGLPGGDGRDIDEPVVGRGERELDGLRRLVGEIEAPEIAEHRHHRRLPVGRDREAVDVGAVEVGEAPTGVGLRADLRAMEVQRPRAAIGDVDELARADEARQPVVAVVRGELREGAGRRVVRPDVAVVGAVVAAARPAGAATLEEDGRAVGRRVRRATEGVVQATRRAARDGHDIRPRRAVEVALDRGVEERDRLAAKGADRRERERRVDRGDRAQVAAVDRHRPEVAEAVAVRLEHDAAAIGRERAPRLAAGRRGEPRRRATGRGGLPEVAAPGEDDRRAIGRERGVTREVDIGRKGGSGARHRSEDRGGERKSGTGKNALRTDWGHFVWILLCDWRRHAPVAA